MDFVKMVRWQLLIKTAIWLQVLCQTGATRARYERHECDTGATRTIRAQHMNLLTTRLKTFSNPYISSTANERLKGEGRLHLKNYLLEMPRSHAKMRLQKPPQKLNFVTTKGISKSYTLDCCCKCPSTFLHNYA